MKKIRVAVIGAGVAGISAAVKLSLEGFEVDVFETRGFLGGRTYSFIDNKTDEEIDNGQHLLMGAYENFFKLLDILDTKKYLEFKDGMSIDYIDLQGKKGKFDTSRFKGKFGLIWGFLNFGMLSNSEKSSVFKFLLKIKLFKNSTPNFTLKEYLIINNQSDNLIKVFWEPLCLATMNQDINNVNTEIFLNVIKIIFLGSYKNAKLVFPQTGLSKLIEPAVDFIEKNSGKFRFNEKITKFIIKNDKIEIMLTSVTKYNYDYYISAIPLYSLAKVLQPELNFNTEYSTIISVYLWYENNPDIPIITAMINSNIHWIFNRRKILSKTNNESGHLAITISSANHLDNLSNEQILDMILYELSLAYPEIRTNTLINSKVIRDKRATIALTNTNIDLRDLFSEDYKNLFIAGDWTNTSLPATIEGACLSGFHTAERIINCTEKKIFD